MKQRTVPLITLSTILIVLAGCIGEPSRVTLENYDKLKMGMAYEAVIEIMGEPDDTSSRMGAKEYTWVDGEKQIHAKFLFDRAVYYSSKGLESGGKAAATTSGH